MRAVRPLLIALPAALALSCGGSETPVHYGSPAEAAEAAATALAGGDARTAASAFESAAATTDARAKAGALEGLFQARLDLGEDSGALAALERLASECAAQLTPDRLNHLATLALNQKNLAVADAVVNKATAMYPNQTQLFAKAVKAVDLLKTQGPGADLSSLGYTGD